MWGNTYTFGCLVSNLMLCSFQFHSSTTVYHASPFDCSDYYLAWFYDEYVSMLILRTVNSVQSRQRCFLKTRQLLYRSTAMSHPACYHSKRTEMSILERNMLFIRLLIVNSRIAWFLRLLGVTLYQVKIQANSLQSFFPWDYTPGYMEKTCRN